MPQKVTREWVMNQNIKFKTHSNDVTNQLKDILK